MGLWGKNILYSTLSSSLCMVDFLSQEPEDSKSDDTKELQYYQLKLMSDSSQNVQWFDNLKQMIIAQIYKEQSK